MTGLEAIAHYNGWTMALIGALIVFSGLVVLSLTISQLHRILPLFERNAPEPQLEKKTTPDLPEKPLLPLRFPMEADEAAKLYQPIVKRLGEKFSLAELYQLARKEGYPHPHLTINLFRNTHFLEPIGEGTFTWHEKHST